MIRRLALGTLLFLSSLTPLPAQAVKDGPEFQVNTYEPYRQLGASVARDGFGNFVIVWQSYGDGSDYGVFGQMFDAAGSAVGGEFQINTSTSGRQAGPRVGMNPFGEFVVVWTGYGDGSQYGIFGQRFSSTGVPQGGEFQVNTFTTYTQAAPSVAVDASGSFVAVWQSNDQDGSGTGIFGRRFDAGGTPAGGEFQVNTYTADQQSLPSVAVHASGDFVVVWQSAGQDGSGYGVFGRRFDGNGAPASGEFSVNAQTLNSQEFPSVAMDALGNFVVVWQSHDQDGSGYGVFGRVFTSSGLPGGEFAVNSHTTADQTNPAVSMDAFGDFAVTWDSDGQDGSYNGVFARQFMAGAIPVGAEFQVNSYTSGNQRRSAVSTDSQGNFVVAWQSYYQDGDTYGIFAQRFSGPLSCPGGDADGDAVCDVIDNCLGIYNPAQGDSDHDGVGDACDVVILAPPGGAILDCSAPLILRPTITWDAGRYDRFRVFFSPDPDFPAKNQVSSGTAFLKATSYTPSGAKWKSACLKAHTAHAPGPALYIKIAGIDVQAKAGNPERGTFSNVVGVAVTP